MVEETIRDELRNTPGAITVGDLIELLEQHRPRKISDGIHSIVACGVCGGVEECYQWRVLRPTVMKNFGLIEVNGVYDVVR